jgi:hypothetical protein
VVVEGGDEHHLRAAPAPPRGRAFEQREAVATGHLDVEQQQVDRVRGEEGDGRVGVGAVADDLDVGLVGEQPPQPPPGDRLVVDDEGANLAVHVGTSLGTASASAVGAGAWASTSGRRMRAT